MRILENVRERDVFVIQPLASPVNQNLVELLIMLDAFKRASASRITAVIPYYAYGRSDRKDQPRVPITARLLADLLTVAGANRVLTVDLHSAQIQGFFNIPVDELTAVYLLSDYFKENLSNHIVVVAADIGISRRARDVANRLKAPLAIIEKRRLGNDDRTESLNIIGEVDGHESAHRRRRDRHRRHAGQRRQHAPQARGERGLLLRHAPHLRRPGHRAHRRLAGERGRRHGQPSAPGEQAVAQDQDALAGPAARRGHSPHPHRQSIGALFESERK